MGRMPFGHHGLPVRVCVLLWVLVWLFFLLFPVGGPRCEILSILPILAILSVVVVVVDRWIFRRAIGRRLDDTPREKFF